MTSISNDPALIGCEARLIRSGEWLRCWLEEITPSGARVVVDHAVAVGERVVACIGEVGAMPGTVSEASDGRCAISFSETAPQTLRARMPACYERA